MLSSLPDNAGFSGRFRKTFRPYAILASSIVRLVSTTIPFHTTLNASVSPAPRSIVKTISDALRALENIERYGTVCCCCRVSVALGEDLIAFASTGCLHHLHIAVYIRADGLAKCVYRSTINRTNLWSRGHFSRFRCRTKLCMCARTL